MVARQFGASSSGKVLNASGKVLNASAKGTTA
jgi:hypothetical protein